MTVSVFDMITMQHLWSTPEMREIFSEQTKLQRWLDFEAALARSQARLGIIPQTAADEITKAATVENIDVAEMSAEIRRIKHTVVPFLKQVQKHLGKEAAECLHYGATTQDVVDTGLILQLRDAHAMIKSRVADVGRELLRLAKEHRDTIIVGRTHGVQALPITFGHKCAIWLDEMARHAERLRECEPRVFLVMAVGAVGSQASYGEHARQIEQDIAQDLGLSVSDVSWAPARDRLAEYTNLLALISATLGKIGNELFNLQRNEFAEIEEGFTEGKLGSSTMPHKRNPVSAENVAMLSRSVRYNAAMMVEAMVQEHERDGIAWKSEWKAIPETVLVTDAALFQATNLLKGLRIDAAKMQRNISMMKGYLLSEKVMLELGKQVGKSTAHEWLYEASMDGIEKGLGFAEALAAHPHVSDTYSAEQIEELTQPQHYLGTIGEQVDRVVARETAGDWLRSA